jgi:catechol 2,3-dioxygenase
MSAPLLPPDTHIGAVHLRVRDLERATAFYEEVLGFSVVGDDGVIASLGAQDERPLLVLHSAPHGPDRPPGSTGLFHVAFRLPARSDLGGMIVRVRNHEWAFDGFGDHNVSEAAYLSDPEGNGVELYADRSEAVWHSVEGQIFMTTEPLDLPGLLLAAEGPAQRLPRGTTVGHVHLRVSSLESAEAFYVGRLGFHVTTRGYPGALFVAAGDYHHHVGCNVWGESAARRPPDGSLGLRSFDIVVPDTEARRCILGGADEGTIFDADDIGVRIARG